MHKHHLLISGTGRAGTTFLVQLLTELGLDTGFSKAHEGIHQACHAGMERNTEEIFNQTAPYVVKSPGLSEQIDKILEAPGVVIDFMIVPIRDLYASAESRRTNARQAKNRKAPGGLWLTKNPRKQEAALAEQFHHLVHALVKHDVPMIWLHFPRLVQDPDYLYGKIKSVLPGQNLESFTRAFRAVSRPELVHEFEQKSSPKKSLLKGLKTWFRP